MKKLSMMLGALMVLSGTKALAAEEGKALFGQRCVACHQANAAGSAPLKAPNLTGLSAAYLQRQLEHFRDGVRGGDPSDAEGQMMRGMSAGLSDEQVSQLSQYLAGLPLVAAPKPTQSAGFAGRGLYSGCTSCHGSQAEGFDGLGAPRLAGQYDWYLKAQLLKFRTGQRGSHVDDKLGQQMGAMAKTIRDEAALDTLVRHIGSLAAE